ncbi:MAG: hypothetical protein ACK4FK_13455 [Ferrovibrio sp.]|jgi:Ni/Co efflux regulator RcnB|uniref:hypothetical protein n=1 Tax=Ferrovibrio sp. TaxID=1917215 RepID=UPI00391A7716
MSRHHSRLVALGLGVAIALGGVIPSLPAFADPPGGHPNKGHQRGTASHQGHKKGGPQDGGISINISFNDQDRMVVHEYFGGLAASGRCPPGLAKKNNGCMPPGQAKKWALGRPLPRDVIFYDLPRELTIRLSPPPAGYRHVRVAADILMIAVGTGMVVAAIEDLARM